MKFVFISMSTEEHFYLGKITKPFGFKGEVVIFLDVDDPSLYHDLNMVFVLTGSGLVPHFFEKFEHKKGNNFRVKIDGISTEEEAKFMVNKELYLPLSILPKLSGKKFYFHEIVGFKVINHQNEELGNIKRVIDLPANPLLEVYSEKLGEILIPIKDEFILKIDREANTFHVQLPEGFEELFI